MLQETLQHNILGGMNYCNVVIGAVFPWSNGSHAYCAYSYSFSLGAMWELITVIQKCPFVRNSVCSQFLEGLFAIFAECSQVCLRSL